MQRRHGGACFLRHVAFPRSLFAGVTTRAGSGVFVLLGMTVCVAEGDGNRERFGF